jgi:probable HAF family extracellular repeat protein
MSPARLALHARLRGLALCCCLLLALATLTPAAAAPAAPPFRMVVLPHLGYDRSSALAINDRGEIVGSSHLTEDRAHAVLWRDGEAIDLGSLGGASAAALDINDAGQVVGTGFLPGNSEVGAFLWERGRLTLLPGLGGSSCSAEAINNSGVIVGSCTTPTTEQRAVRWVNGAIAELDPPSQPAQSQAFDINARGQVAGASRAFAFNPHAAVWERGALREIGVFGRDYSEALRINSQGTVLLQATTFGPENEEVSFFLWRRGRSVDLSPLVGAGAYVSALNDRGQLAGRSLVGERTRATLWDRGAAVLLPQGDDPFASDVFDLNNHGQLVGEYTSNDLVRRAVLWTPVPSGAQR